MCDCNLNAIIIRHLKLLDICFHKNEISHVYLIENLLYPFVFLIFGIVTNEN